MLQRAAFATFAACAARVSASVGASTSRRAAHDRPGGRRHQ
ncbi:hypothetical protein BVI2075_430018 [Burkholderia vietnamiensis]|nr:hypothetical protein BVI2075_430018 [Burkholderia vietnamiensis]